MMYYVKFVMKNGNCLVVIFKKMMVNIFCFISFSTAVGEKSVGLNLQEQGVYVPVK